MVTRRDSRQLILSAAREEFARGGFAAARVERIARRAGVNKQLIFYYFGSKAELFHTIIESLARHVAASAVAQNNHERPLDELRATIVMIWDALMQQRNLLRAALLAPADDEAPVTPLRAALAPVAERIRALISRGQGLGYVRDDIDPDAVAFQVLATAVGYVSLADVLTPGDATRRERVPIELLLRAITW